MKIRLSNLILLVVFGLLIVDFYNVNAKSSSKKKHHSEFNENGFNELRSLFLWILNLLFGTNEGSTLPMLVDEIVPDVFDSLPSGVLQVHFESGVCVSMGNELTPEQVKSAPTNLTWNTEPNAYYTLLMTDPDAPSRAEPTLREILHWLVVNIPGTDVASGEVYANYAPSEPPEGTGFHRYVLSVFKQPRAQLKLNRTKIVDSDDDLRIGFNTKKFVNENRLGTPVAGNFFHSQFQEEN